MPNLLHFFFDCDRSRATPITEKLCHIPSLVTVEFLQTSLISVNDLRQTPGSLQRVVWKDADIIRQDGWIAVNNAASDLSDYDMVRNELRRSIMTIYSRDPPNYATPTYATFFNALRLGSHTLQQLEIEMALFCQLSLASPLDFPHIRTLVLHEDLQVLVHQNVDNNYFISGYPDEGEGQFITESITSFYPSLRSISLSSLFLGDAIFHHLAPSVCRASLSHYGGGNEHMGEFLDEDLFLDPIAAMAHSGASITELYVTLRDIPSPSFVFQVASLLPQLCTFTATIPSISFEASEDEDLANLKNGMLMRCPTLQRECAWMSY